tara:strand:+ start:3800 stop:4489 length:690 start_codon:yes stop_codon:yes gene_type:complete
MAKIPERLKQIFQELQLEPQDAVWDCHGTPVAYHKALEQVAEHLKIVFDLPTIIDASAEKKYAAVLVSGRLGDRFEWSVGEAASYNNKNSYPFAMAEKRAKDRVILKLIGVAGFVYSEEEADSFKEDLARNINTAALAALSIEVERPEPAPEPAVEEPECSAWETWANSAMNKIKKLASQEGGASKLTGWLSGNMTDLKGLKAADQQLFELLRAFYDEHYEKANTGERT